LVHEILPISTNKKAQVPKNRGLRFLKSGVGGVRTLVQTMSFQAFYMLIQ